MYEHEQSDRPQKEECDGSLSDCVANRERRYQDLRCAGHSDETARDRMKEWSLACMACSDGAAGVNGVEL